MGSAAAEAGAAEPGAAEPDAAEPGAEVREGSGGALAPGARVGERYELEAVIGEGTFATVYRARDRAVPTHRVALKLLHEPAAGDERQLRATRELEALAAVFHPSLVQLKDYGWHEGRLWIVMPLYRGPTLADRVAERPLTRAEALRVFRPIARALAALHAAGMRHQDVKPENIILARLGDAGDEELTESSTLPVLIDLGVAAQRAENLFAGTPEYFAPEVASRFVGQARPVDDRADVFALALCVRDALAPPADEEIDDEAFEGFLAERARWSEADVTPPGAPGLRDLAPTLARWLHPDPGERPRAAELARELDVLVEPDRRRRRRRRLLRWVAPLLAVALTVLGAGVWAWRTEAARAERALADAMRIAELERQQASQARARERQAEASLERGEQELETLESEMQDLARRYERGALTRSELAQRLAGTEQALERAEERATAARANASRLRRTNEDLSRAYASLREQLERAQARASRGARRDATGPREGQPRRDEPRGATSGPPGPSVPDSPY